MLYKEKNIHPAFTPKPDFVFAPFGKRRPDERPLVVVFSRDEDAGFLYRTLLEKFCRVEAVSRLKDLKKVAGDAPPDLILMDGMLQFEKTLEDIRRLRRARAFKEIPLILVSGFASPHFRERALTVGADEFLVKPLDFDSLERRVEKTFKLASL
ncbi:MAG TPA: response regulator [Pyrinomonadaceae bacterium]|jgi:DNA-binding response OmpR family regulator